jgi:hypothetical protein
MFFKKPKILLFLISVIIILTLILLFTLPKVKNPIQYFKEIYDYKSDFFISPYTKYYKSTEFDNRVDDFFTNCFPDANECYIIKNILEKFGTYGDIFVNGGFVRDLCLGVKPRDVDIQFSLNNKEDVDKVCKDLGLNYIDFREVNKTSKYVYVKFTDLIECQTMRKLELQNLENDVNSLFYDCKNKVIVDFTGTGFLNNLNLKFRIIQPTFDDWLNRKWQGQEGVDNKAPIRVFKMFKKGYTLQEEQGKSMNDLRTWFRGKIDFLKNTRVNSPPDGNNFPILPWVLLSMRGDDLNYKDVSIIKKGDYDMYLEEILYEMKKFDYILFKNVIENLIIYDKTLEKHRWI